MLDLTLATLPKPIRLLAMLVPLLLALAAPLGLGLRTAEAQSLVATADDKPITGYDVEMRMKLLRVLKQPATYDDALESMVADILKTEDTQKYAINPSDSDIAITLNREALKLKTNAQALLNAFQRVGVTQEHWHDHYKADTAWLIYVHALNKDLEVSDADVRAAIAGGQNKSTSTQYLVQQIIFVLPINGADAVAGARMREAQELRDHFTDCHSGPALARGLTDVAVKDPVTRLGSSLDQQTRDLLDHTDIGHLTAPQRTSDGITMLAVCSRSLTQDTSTADQDVRENLLADKLDVEAEELYKQLRAKAIVAKR